MWMETRPEPLAEALSTAPLMSFVTGSRSNGVEAWRNKNFPALLGRQPPSSCIPSIANVISGACPVIEIMG